MILSVHQPQYIPWLGYFAKIEKSDCFVFLDRVQYKCREFQNRNKIRCRQGWMWLTVPVISKGRPAQEIRDCIIDESFPWRRKHLNSLKSCYGASKFFKEHLSFFEETYSKKWERLVELNVHIINYILRELGITTPVAFESSLGIAAKSTDRILEICRRQNCDVYLSGLGGKSYLEEGKFAREGIKLVYQDFVHPLYRQQFAGSKLDFIPYMSALDLLFNEGPDSMEFLLLSHQ